MKTIIKASGWVVLSLGFFTGGCAQKSSTTSPSLKNPEVAAQVKSFIAEKEAQEKQLIKADEKTFPDYAREGLQVVKPDCQPFFTAAAKGNWPMVSNLWSQMERHTFGLSPTRITNGYPRGMWLEPAKETYGAVEAFVAGDEKYSRAFGEDIIRSIPPGSIYFGGTDPGRFIVTALEKSQVKGDPFFTLTQNDLANFRYLQYLRSMYGEKIYTPAGADLQRCFNDYVEDMQRRAKEHKLKPGEHLNERTNNNGAVSIQISGQTAVMAINGLLVKVMFDKNPGQEFFIEQSLPLDWMYPYLEPHGLIFKINRQPMAELPDKIVQQDHHYWTRLIQPMIGDWLNDDTSVQEITHFASKVFLDHDFSGFTGDRQFVQNDHSCRMFSKERVSIAGLYAWRAQHATDPGVRQRMNDAADFAYRQAWALCPYSLEVVYRYARLLTGEKRFSDALLIAETAAKMPELKGRNGQNLRVMIAQLKRHVK